MPKVSVIIPVFQAEKYIARCVQSLFEQTLDDIEFIFIDDCCTDNSMAVLYGMMDKYPKRKNQSVVIHNAINQGIAATRKIGVLASNGEYVIHCDSDDWVENWLCTELYYSAVNNQADIAICDYKKINNDKLLSIHRGCYSLCPERFVEELLYETAGWTMWNKMVKRTLYEKIWIWPVENIGEDMLLTVQLSLLCKKMSYVPMCGYSYCFNSQSLSNAVNRSFGDDDRFVQNLKNFNLLLTAFRINGCFRKYSKALDFTKFSIKYKLQWCSDSLKSQNRLLFPMVQYKVLFDKKCPNEKKELAWWYIKNSIVIKYTKICQSLHK